ncbi:MAG: polyprenyl synthetase family protein, partial [Bacteroidaceae bacterium]|nr:polyprenyl synthetase family protein [Bacteroidaceae bacterium]
AVMRLFTETALEIGEGQQYDMLFETRMDVTEDEYIEMIRLKTSVLLACALRMGAMLADAPEADAQALYAFGENLGLAFQLQDDYLDVYGDEKVFGKRIGGDILCNKKTYMLINALLRADARQRQELDDWLSRATYDEAEKIAAVTRLYDEMHIAALAQAKMEQYYQRALQWLDKVAVSDERKAELRAVADALMKRQK